MHGIQRQVDLQHIHTGLAQKAEQRTLGLAIDRLLNPGISI